MFSCNLPPALLAEWPDFLRAAVVTRGWNGYRNKSQHRKSTLEMKILPPFQQGFEPATFQSRVRCSNHWAIPAPNVILDAWLYPFIARIFNVHGSGVLIALFECCKAGVTWNCCRLGASSVYTIQPCISLQGHFVQSHMGRVYVCLAVTCHLHIWRNDKGGGGWGGECRNKSQHRKLTVEKKILPLLPGLEPGTLRSRVQFFVLLLHMRENVLLLNWQCILIEIKIN